MEEDSTSQRTRSTGRSTEGQASVNLLKSVMSAGVNSPGLKKYVEREGKPGAEKPSDGATVDVHFTVRRRSDDVEIDSSRGEEN